MSIFIISAFYKSHSREWLFILGYITWGVSDKIKSKLVNYTMVDGEVNYEEVKRVV